MCLARVPTKKKTIEVQIIDISKLFNKNHGNLNLSQEEDTTKTNNKRDTSCHHPVFVL
jgi:hypothetical protein